MTAQNKSGGMNTNREHFGPGVEFGPGVSEAYRDLIFDPQTSGGLLIAVASSSADAAFSSLQEGGISAAFVGSVVAPNGPKLKFG
jgi:selenide,water dikinase